MRKNAKDQLFSLLSVGILLILMLCELACGNLTKPEMLTADSAAVFADTGKSELNTLTVADSPQANGKDNDSRMAWGFVLAAAIAILIVAIVVAVVKKRRSNDQ